MSASSTEDVAVLFALALARVDVAVKRHMKSGPSAAETVFEHLQTAFKTHVVPLIRDKLLQAPLQYFSVNDTQSDLSFTPALCCKELLRLNAFLKDADVWYLTFSAATQLLDEAKPPKGAKKRAREESVLSQKDMFYRAFVLGSTHRVPTAATKSVGNTIMRGKRRGALPLTLRWAESMNQAKKSVEDSESYKFAKSSERKQMTEKTVLALFSEREHRALYTRFWVSLLSHRDQFPAELNAHLLRTLAVDVLPFLTNSLLLADYFYAMLDAEQGCEGLLAILSLRGIFTLMIDHNLEFPNFYEKLYVLISPNNIAAVAHRQELFRLLEIALLKSVRVPSYVAAAVAKRILRVAILSPSPALYFVLPFVRQVLQRHQNCLSLIHRTAGDLSLANDEEAETTTVDQKAKAQKMILGLFDGKDPYIDSERNLSKTNALYSTLWELCAVEKHFLPPCPLFVSSFSSTATDTAPLHCEKTYVDLFKSEIGKEKDGQRGAPVAYRQCNLAGLGACNCFFRV